MEPEIIVRGTGRVQVMPDRAVVRVEVDGDGGSRDEAYQQAAPLARAVDEVVEAHRTAIARVVTAALAVHPRTRWRRGEPVRTGWRARRVTVLDVTDAGHLGELLGSLAAAGGAVTGPDWQVDPDNPGYAEARRLAAGDARHRATAYAEALGLTVGGVAWVAEPGLRRGGPGDGGAPVMRAMAASAAEGAADVIEVVPDAVTVDAAVEVAFTFVEPTP